MKCKFIKINGVYIKYKCVRSVKASDVAMTVVLLDNSLIQAKFETPLDDLYQQFESMLNKYVQQQFIYRNSTDKGILDLDYIASNPKAVINRLLSEKFLEHLKLACIGLYDSNVCFANSFKYGGYKKIFDDGIITCSVLKEAEPIEYYKNNMVFIGEIGYKGLTLVYFIDKTLFEISGLEDNKLLDYIISQADKIKDNAKYYY
jgi:hypothetical protein